MKAYNKTQLEMMDKLNLKIKDVEFFSAICDLMDDYESTSILKEDAAMHLVAFGSMTVSMFFYRMRTMRSAGFIEKDIPENITLTNQGKLYKLLIEQDKGQKYVSISGAFIYSHMIDCSYVISTKRQSTYGTPEDKERKNRFFMEAGVAKRLIESNSRNAKFIRL